MKIVRWHMVRIAMAGELVGYRRLILQRGVWAITAKHGDVTLGFAVTHVPSGLAACKTSLHGAPEPGLSIGAAKRLLEALYEVAPQWRAGASLRVTGLEQRTLMLGPQYAALQSAYTRWYYREQERQRGQP